MAATMLLAAVPQQQRPTLSEEAAAAIDADAAHDKASGGTSQKKVTDSGKASPSGTHNTNGDAVDGSQVADKVLLQRVSGSGGVFEENLTSYLFTA